MPRIKVKNIKIIDDYYLDNQKAYYDLNREINQWLNSKQFNKIRFTLWADFSPSEEIIFLIQTDNTYLKIIAWHLWNFFDTYRKAEVALYIPEPQETKISDYLKSQNKVKVLAIFGDNVGIDIQKDRALLEELPDAEVQILIQPTRQIFSDCFWKQNWDILFFAGHSETKNNNGRIFLNQENSLNIDELKFSLRKAIDKGLKLAIFNSCDGLGLAQNLAELGLPQVIVMREKILDKVDQ
ncbi:MAG: CHAT domain-containing protein [Moorea sp. SIO2B7]|nr:CHAT domain-containing protein [Moorena sp. SIO2B7]